MGITGYAVVQLPDFLFRVFDYLTGSKKTEPGQKTKSEVVKEPKANTIFPVLHGTEKKNLIKSLKDDIIRFKCEMNDIDERLCLLENHLI